MFGYVCQDVLYGSADCLEDNLSHADFLYFGKGTANRFSGRSVLVFSRLFFFTTFLENCDGI